MVHFSLAALALFVVSAQSAPLEKRIAQNIPDSTKKWEAACRKAGGGQTCNPIAVKSFGTLLAAPGPCEQQDAADTMVDKAKELKNDPDMIKFAQIFAQQPRNSPSSESVPYCQKAPKNAELKGLFQCQFAGTKKDTFVPNTPVGKPGTIPFGMTAPVNPPGSCPANPGGPIPDGKQLTDIVNSPGVGAAPAPGAKKGGAAPDNGAAPAKKAGKAGKKAGKAAKNGAQPAGAASPGAASPDAAAPAPATPAAGFKAKNGQDAQAQNKQDAALTADSPCKDGEQACINGGFAQCVGGKFAVTPCAGGTQCFALPLVNKPGTSRACTTEKEASDRIKASGAAGGITG